MSVTIKGLEITSYEITLKDFVTGDVKATLSKSKHGQDNYWILDFGNRAINLFDIINVIVEIIENETLGIKEIALGNEIRILKKDHYLGTVKTKENNSKGYYELLLKYFSAKKNE